MYMQENLTPHRIAVLELVRAGEDHPTAREVFERSARQSPRLSFATVYNALKYLTDAKLLRTIRVGDDAVRYDAVMEPHQHLVCRVCGRIDDAVGVREPILPEGRTGQKGFLVESISVQFLGICAECRNPEKAGPKKKAASKKAQGQSMD
ncbi:MAG: transcriptional repressor [Fibrobacteres bacterium]|nr:transcriptional repressor [Fibrobacterota bacterium]